MRRFFLACTPRTGNTWFRRLLGGVLEMPDFAEHTPKQIDWDRLPARCIVAMHWRYSTAFHGFLRERGFGILTTVRHPLDVLTSILQFSAHDPTTEQWLSGECGNERSLAGATPTSDAFVDYALSRRAEALFDVGLDWAAAGAHVVRYEELVKAPETALARTTKTLRLKARANVADVLSKHSFEASRRTAPHHFWRGKPEGWKAFIVAKNAAEIAARHALVFSAFGYVCDPDLALDPGRAALNWRNALAETNGSLHGKPAVNASGWR